MLAVTSFMVATSDAGRFFWILALSVLGVLALAIAGRRARGTTLIAAWGWALASLSTLVICELLTAYSRDANNSPAGWLVRLRYAAAITTFAPTMAVLGAKRPQHRAWQFIVLALLGILALPSFEAALFAVGPQPLDLHVARRWFLAILIVVGLVNYLPTHTWPASLAYAVAQTFLLADYLPLVSLSQHEWLATTGLALMVAAFWMVALGWPGRRRSHGVDRLWLDFRDAYGMVWALRVQERYNATAAKDGWPVRLGWRGMNCVEPAAGTDAIGAESPDSVAARPPKSVAARSPDRAAQEIDPAGPELRGLASLLRRFVSREWIARRFKPVSDH